VNPVPGIRIDGSGRVGEPVIELSPNDNRAALLTTSQVISDMVVQVAIVVHHVSTVIPITSASDLAVSSTGINLTVLQGKTTTVELEPPLGEVSYPNALDDYTLSGVQMETPKVSN
jgi:hypothetical protein